MGIKGTGKGLSRRNHMVMDACFLMSLLGSSRVSAQTSKNAPFTAGFDAIKDSLIRISSDSSTIGLGFIAAIDGKQYVISNATVISGHTRFQLETLSGKPVRPTRIELSSNRDLARLQVSGEKALTVSPSVIDEHVAALDYLTAADVKSQAGSVTKLSADMIEVSMAFNDTHRGGPLINENMDVGGVISHLVYYKANGRNWEGTDRSFAYKLNGAAWYSPNWKSYNQTYGKYLREVDLFRGTVYEIANDWVNQPKRGIETKESLSLDFDRWIKQHNGMVSDLSKKRSKGSGNDANSKLQKRFQESCDGLSKICMSKADYLLFLCDDKKISPYLRIQFKWRALELKKLLPVHRCTCHVYGTIPLDVAIRFHFVGFR